MRTVLARSFFRLTVLALDKVLPGPKPVRPPPTTAGPINTAT
ncbi:MAG: hypothetical protein WCP28_07115 [Actinomycetes bacterium]